MGLRIYTNSDAIRAMMNLSVTDRNQARSLERLSTGLRINRASDDPSGLVISENLRAQLVSLQRAVQNTQTGANLLNTADAALDKLSNELKIIKDAVTFALNSGSADADQIATQQDAVNNAIAAINRIANTTRFANRNLLNGSSDFVYSGVDSRVNNLLVKQIAFAEGQSKITMKFSLTQAASRAAIDIGPVSAAGTVIRVQGPRGSADITLSTVASAAVASAINQFAGYTGVFASAVGTNRYALSEDFGSAQTIQIQVISGKITLNGAVKSANQSVLDAGQDAKIAMLGVSYTGSGKYFNINNSFGVMTFDLDEGTNVASLPTSSYQNVSFTVKKGNSLTFQLNTKALATDSLIMALPSVNASSLGFEPVPDVIARAVSGSTTVMKGGYLSSLVSGAENDLNSNPANASRIVDYAIAQVNKLRGFIGAVTENNLNANRDSLEVAIQNLSASESLIRDLNFAEETTMFTRSQILFQSGIAVLASANLVPQSVLTLLR